MSPAPARAAVAMTALAKAAVAKAAVLGAASVLLAACTASGPSDEPKDDAVGRVTVLAAASLTESFDGLAAAFEKRHPGVDVVIGYGGSSGLAEQVIIGGIPADVFAAANEATMAAVEDAGLAEPWRIFATNTLALVVAPGNPFHIVGLDDLARPELAIALCDHAVPCGTATDQLLALAGVIAAPDTLEPDVKTVLTRVRLGEADAGLVYVTDAVAAAAEVATVAVREADAVVNRYPIAVLSEAPEPVLAAAFVDFVLGAEARAVLERAGFGSP